MRARQKCHHININRRRLYVHVCLHIYPAPIHHSHGTAQPHCWPHSSGPGALCLRCSFSSIRACLWPGPSYGDGRASCLPSKCTFTHICTTRQQTSSHDCLALNWMPLMCMLPCSLNASGMQDTIFYCTQLQCQGHPTCCILLCSTGIPVTFD